MNCCAYHRPTSLDEALELVAKNPDAKFIGGGTDLLVKMRRRFSAAPGELISLRRIDELMRVEETQGCLRIGAGVPLADLAVNDHVRERLPALTEAIALFGSRQIRNVATVGGNLCNASPGADCAPPLLVHGARLELRSASGVREVPLAEFFRGPGETTLGAGEILTAILIDHPRGRAVSTFLRKSRVSMDLAIASVAVFLEYDGALCTLARIAAGAVAPTPLRLEAAERALEGTELDEDACSAAALAVDVAISPISDVRAEDWYRRHLTGVLLRRALTRLTRATETVGGGAR
ncbi:MAG: xanthine dehydrogenase family protein subunit M [Planctomycetota bacterium]